MTFLLLRISPLSSSWALRYCQSFQEGAPVRSCAPHTNFDVFTQDKQYNDQLSPVSGTRSLINKHLQPYNPNQTIFRITCLA